MKKQLPKHSILCTTNLIYKSIFMPSFLQASPPTIVMGFLLIITDNSYSRKDISTHFMHNIKLFLHFIFALYERNPSLP